MSSLSQNLSKLWQFLWIKVRWNLNFSKFSNLEILLNSLNFCPTFCMWAQILNIYNLCIITWGLKPLLPWFPGGGGQILPPPLGRNRHPLGDRVHKSLWWSMTILLGSSSEIQCNVLLNLFNFWQHFKVFLSRIF